MYLFNVAVLLGVQSSYSSRVFTRVCYQ